MARKHTAATDEFKAQPKDQTTAIDMNLMKLESKLLKEIVLSKDALIKTQNVIIDKQEIIRSYMEAELLAIKHKLHYRGVIERLEM